MRGLSSRSRYVIRQFISFRQIIATFIAFPAMGFGLLVLAVSITAGRGSPTEGMAQLFHFAAGHVTVSHDGFLAQECQPKAPIPSPLGLSALPPPMPCTTSITKQVTVKEAAADISPIFWSIYIILVLVSLLSWTYSFSNRWQRYGVLSPCRATEFKINMVLEGGWD